MSAVGTPEAARQASVSFRQVDYWVRVGAVVPSIAEADGSGTRRLWNAQDVRMLAAIGRVVADLATLDIQSSAGLVARLWRELNAHANVVLSQGTVSISVGLVATVS